MLNIDICRIIYIMKPNYILKDILSYAGSTLLGQNLKQHRDHYLDLNALDMLFWLKFFIQLNVRSNAHELYEV